MDSVIASRFNDTLLATACRRYGIPSGSVKLLDGFESIIYEFTRPDGDFILRIGHSSRRTPALICGEVDWINTLADAGVGVARAIYSRSGDLVEPLADGHGGQFLCTAFVKARGCIAREEHFNERLYLNYGQLLGRMHAAAKTYQPSNPAWRRYAWDSDENNTPDRQIPPEDHVIHARYKAVFDHLRSLSRDSEGYGMIHQDAHLGNLFVDEDYALTLFDFDDCVYGHFIYDIAMVLFYISMHDEEDPARFTAAFMPVFLQGYRQHNRLHGCWLCEIPHFLKLREIDLFAAILSTYGETPQDEWCAGYMQGRRARIENDIPYLVFDWDSLLPHL